MVSIARVTIAWMLLLVLGTAGLAETGKEPTAEEEPGPPYRALATRAVLGTPEIDGRLDEAAWAKAEPITDFVQRDPEEGSPATERTVVRVLYDDRALYVGIRAYDSQPDEIIGQLTRRDQHSPSDWLVVGIDSYYDRRTAFEFRVNPAGVELDRYLYDDTEEDDSWNAVWEAATGVDEEGWVAEFRIPFSQLRFSKAHSQVWGFNLERVIQRKNETDQWKPIPKDGSGWVSEFGELVGIEGIEPPRRLEILPYVAATQALTPRVDGNPFETGSEFDGSLGGDIRYGLTNSLTLNLTLNPDFGQVEADPSVVNLSAVETFFEEKRPFFLESANIFRFGLEGGDGAVEQLFYSRRVGRRPQGSVDAPGGHVDYPARTTIIGAGKLSGKSNGWSLGALDAVTAKERATVIDAGGIRSQETVEPLTNYGVLRVQKDLYDGGTAVGGIVTAVNRSLAQSMDYLRSSAYAGGLDGRHRFGGGNWEVTAQLLGSHVRGSTEAIAATQRSSARYFQRPDAEHLDYDPTRTSLTGTSGSLGVSKIGGGHWRGIVSSRWVSPGFEVNDLGFLRQSDSWRHSMWVGYREFDPGRVFRRYSINWNAWDWRTFGNEVTARGTNVNGNFTLLNYWGGFAGLNRQFESVAPRVLRGGPAVKGPGGWEWWVGGFTDNRRPVVLEVQTWRWSDDERSEAGGFFAGMSWRPASSLRLALTPGYHWNRDAWQYVGTEEDAGGGAHYLMGVLDQKTLSLTTRLDWTFTPNLSLQLYAQPYISSGDFVDFSEVAAPKADDYEDRFSRFAADRVMYVASEGPTSPGAYLIDLDGDGQADISFDDPDFTFRQLHSTLVLRWEYVPGSTLFFVWSQSKTLYDYAAGFDPIDDLDSLRRVDGDNIFSIKVNYYLNP